MYIAFKWLLSLTFVMWVAMCSIDIFIKKNKDITDGDFQVRPLVQYHIKNRTVPQNNKLRFHTQTPLSFIHRVREKPIDMMNLHVVMFLAGALVVSCYKRMTKLYSITKRELATVFTTATKTRIQEHAKVVLAEVNRISLLFYNIARQYLNDAVHKSINASGAIIVKLTKKPTVNHLQLKKIKELCEERKQLGQLLIAAIHENKNIRMQYQLETLAKNRLVRHIESTQKAIKENRTKYVSFQQLYLATHQENIFLKSRIKKLTQEKEENSKNLLELVNEIYKSKNNDLRAYCSRFIVNTKDNLLNSDVGAEINTFLNRKSHMPKAKQSSCGLSDVVHDLHGDSRSCASCSQIMDNIMIPFCTDAPKLKGLPGEYVWTVKDKHGLIEKLYEYDCEPDFENGDTIRRIREYSVYFDKDCLLDFSNSSTVVNDTRSTHSGAFVSKGRLDFPLTRQNFLTGSEAFQRFMENNKNLVSTSMLPVSRSYK